MTYRRCDKVLFLWSVTQKRTIGKAFASLQ